MQIVPQYIDVEDRIAGPLTWKHLGWLFAGGAMLLVAWVFLDRMTFYIVAVVIAMITVGLAFVRPNGVSMIEFLGHGFGYFFRPKVYTWQREVQKNVPQKKKKDIKITSTSEEKKLTSDDIAVIAKTLDSHGVERNERLQQLLKEQANKNTQSK